MSGAGGGLYVQYSVCTVSGRVLFADNSAFWGGGACAMTQNEVRIMGDVEMIRNHGVLGGGMYVDTNIEFEVKWRRG